MVTVSACGTPSKTGTTAGAETGAAPSGQPGGEGAMSQEAMAREKLEAPSMEVADLQDVNFDFDKSDIRSDARDILGKNADWITAHPEYSVQIEGHCDERGTAEYNLALGERRANSVKNYLAQMGVDSNRLVTISYGEELPLDPGHDDAAWAKNRRAHFLVVKTPR
ncbi:MAG: peptidoglycan-associated lipoprotein Pal [Nitrospinae bacterium]|nr:peptidoglycan-associated lipoprotein Pal [Nitrospinota bacterium]